MILKAFTKVYETRHHSVAYTMRLQLIFKLLMPNRMTANERRLAEFWAGKDLVL